MGVYWYKYVDTGSSANKPPADIRNFGMTITQTGKLVIFGGQKKCNTLSNSF